ncbi:MAG: discoidin domain-containing protein [Pirellulaceae bacterium]|nr:discoidin domain-containing protein [Pirellulaceae bacterium]
MKSSRIPVGWCAAAVVLFCVSVAAADPLDLAGSLRPLIEADWQRQDSSLAADARSSGRSTAGPASSSVTTAEDAAGGCDGIRNGLWGFHVASGEQDPWWQVDLGRECRLDRVVVYNRCGNSAARTSHLQILVAGGDGDEACKTFRRVYQHNGTPFHGVENQPLTVRFAEQAVTARIVRLQVPGRCSLALDEVEVYATDDPAKNIALNQPADQISVSQYSRRGTMSDAQYREIGFEPLVARPADASVDQEKPSASTAESDPGRDHPLTLSRQVLQQAELLAARLTDVAPTALQPALDQLAALQARLAGLESSDEASAEDRRRLYLAAREVKRRITFSNPRLNIDRLLFLKRHDSVGVFHMCDQFYGCNAKPGGGLYVLEDPFGAEPRLTNLLEDSVVENGRLAGRKLEGGTFLSPEVSWDGRTVLFAYSEAGVWEKYQGREAYEWTPECSYHIFRVNADGSGLVQLTDGPHNDFDPCFLPNGRIAFVSERRGGYLRCGRHCPVYTMFSMRPDGSDIICLSYHETHEWQPSVTNDGMLVYSRWDYVDRDTNIAHHKWICFPDGRDPRALHGNYPERRESRPWMEMDIRAVPDSNKFVAVTGAHHGHAFGSLVLIDPRVEDDRAMSQLERLTPDVPFPEAEGRPIANYMCYGTPWPLSEDDYLCVYDGDAKNRGIYWLDRSGNRELVYRDPQISCLSPIPLQARPVPPVIPSRTSQAAEDAAKDRPPTIAVMNVYDADFSWPPETQIQALRVFQLLPKSTAPPNQPRIGIANQTNARAVLGTVPVESDGSAYFEAPVGMPIYFQAIDQHGTAVQSMRSATYVHPGEQMVCLGCHERKHDPPKMPARLPLAMQRAPSPIQPDVDGSNPFSYVRLVQPVLDRHCVSCHQEKKALDLTGLSGAANGWTRSYANLAEKYGFYFHVGNGSIHQGIHGGSRTIPGQFGARVAPLQKYLGPDHYGVELPAEDRHRINLWLDANSEFFGSYENTAAQSRGEVVRPTLQ